ncbi:hypothetical protein [Hydrogenophaga sp.]|uniref:hypothetical protein n=1 Tax=Hydrogenophaga sp. TaxID=1904254 RepID=UPI0035B2B992
MRAQFHPLTRRLLATLALCAALPVVAQTAPGKAAEPAESQPLAAGESKVMERITHEDALSRIDELRVGGQTRSIDVKPKNGAPAYEIQPVTGADSANDGQGSSGRSRWRILSF